MWLPVVLLLRCYDETPTRHKGDDVYIVTELSQIKLYILEVKLYILKVKFQSAALPVFKTAYFSILRWL